MARPAGLRLRHPGRRLRPASLFEIAPAIFVEPAGIDFVGISQFLVLPHRAVARPAGLEPATLGLEGRCSIQLSYGRSVVSSGGSMVGAEGFEPSTLCSQSRCATRLRYAPSKPPCWRACGQLSDRPIQGSRGLTWGDRVSHGGRRPLSGSAPPRCFVHHWNESLIPRPSSSRLAPALPLRQRLAAWRTMLMNRSSDCPGQSISSRSRARVRIRRRESQFLAVDHADRALQRSIQE